MAKKNFLNRKQIIDKIMEKKEFSELPRKEVERVYSKFDQDNYLPEEKIKLTRKLLMELYTVFLSKKLLNFKDKSSEWFLKKHFSTRERFGHYEEIYSRCFKGLGKKISVFDLGCGINGFSYDYFPFEINYFGMEIIGQLVKLQNNYFKKEKKKAICVQGSLFDLNFVRKFLSQGKGKKVVFLFKVLDSLEKMEKDSSKRFLLDIFKKVDRVVVSYATKTLIKKRSFFAKRKWLKKFIFDNFEILDEFEFGSEKYLVFEKK